MRAIVGRMRRKRGRWLKGMQPLVDLWVGGPGADGRGLDAANWGYDPAPGLQIVSPSAYAGGVGPLVRDPSGWVPKAAGRLAALQITPSGRIWYGPAPAATNYILYSSGQNLGMWATRSGTSLSVSHANNWMQLRGLGLAGVNDIWQHAVLPNGARCGLAFLLRKISNGVLRVLNPVNASAGEWRVDLSALGPGEHLITRRHPAVTVIAEMQRYLGTAAGIHFAALEGQIDVDVRACTVVPVDDYNWFVPIETLGAPVGIVAEQVRLSGLDLNNCTIAVRAEEFVASRMGARLWGASPNIYNAQYVASDNTHNTAVFNQATGQWFGVVVPAGTRLYWFRRAGADWWQGYDSQPLTHGNIGSTDWSNVVVYVGGTSYSFEHLMQPIRRFCYWPKVLSDVNRAAVYERIVAAEKSS